MKKIFISILVMLCLSMAVFAHTPLMFLEDNYDGTILVECGFSDGSSASKMNIIVVEDKPYKGEEESYDGKRVLFKTKLDDMGCATIFKPNQDIKNYLIIFDAGPGHIVIEKGIVLVNDEVKKWRIAIRSKKSKKELGKWFDLLYGSK